MASDVYFPVQKQTAHLRIAGMSGADRWRALGAQARNVILLCQQSPKSPSGAHSSWCQGTRGPHGRRMSIYRTLSPQRIICKTSHTDEMHRAMSTALIFFRTKYKQIVCYNTDLKGGNSCVPPHPSTASPRTNTRQKNNATCAAVVKQL